MEQQPKIELHWPAVVLPMYSALERAREIRTRSKMLCYRVEKQRQELRRLSEQYWEEYGRAYG